MKKIMFSDKFGLTEAVLSGRKTMTRRIITCPKSFKGEWVAGFHVYRRQSDNAILEYPCMYDADERDFDGGQILPKYKVGEVVAVAQSYHSFYNDECDPRMFPNGAGWTNKMFVRADLMPFQIRFTGVRMERLQDISDEDCMAEGIDYVNGYSESYFFGFGVKFGKGWIRLGNTPREAYAALIARISGKGTWESNPYVFVYEFELVK